jgi:hypothetical protein
MQLCYPLRFLLIILLSELKISCIESVGGENEGLVSINSASTTRKVQKWFNIIV